MKIFLTQILLPTVIFAAAILLAVAFPKFAFCFVAVAGIVILAVLVRGAIELRKLEKEDYFEIEKE